MNNIILNEEVKIKDMIYKIRGKQVMLDSDLARLYQCKNGSKTINQSVKRHINRFPNDFYFQLTDEDCYQLRSQLGTTNKMSSSNPYAFTEQGVAMLATVMQYNNIELKINNTFHDRFIIIDKKILYHCGASFKDLGKKCFEISKIEDRDILDKLLKKIL